MYPLIEARPGNIKTVSQLQRWDEWFIERYLLKHHWKSQNFTSDPAIPACVSSDVNTTHTKELQSCVRERSRLIFKPTSVPFLFSVPAHYSFLDQTLGRIKLSPFIPILPPVARRLLSPRLLIPLPSPIPAPAFPLFLHSFVRSQHLGCCCRLYGCLATLWSTRGVPPLPWQP